MRCRGQCGLRRGRGGGSEGHIAVASGRRGRSWRDRGGGCQYYVGGCKCGGVCGGGAGSANVTFTFASATTFNAIRSCEDVYHSKQAIAQYKIEYSSGAGWTDVTTRGHTVGIGTIDLLPKPVTATQLRWSCLQSESGSGDAVLAAVELYAAHPPAGGQWGS